jgi:hypothetical protein
MYPPSAFENVGKMALNSPQRVNRRIMGVNESKCGRGPEYGWSMLPLSGCYHQVGVSASIVGVEPRPWVHRVLFIL